MDVGVVEGLLIADRESAELAVAESVENSPLPAVVIVAPQHILFVNCLPFLLDAIRVQFRRFKEL